MKKSEKIISAVLMMVLGIMFIILKDKFIGLLMTVLGISLIVLGVVDIVEKCIPPAVVKIVSGVLVIICGWVVVEAVLYILAGVLLVFGIWLLYYKIKNRIRGENFWRAVLEYATPAICIAIGILLLFHRGAVVNFIFIISGILTFIEGGLMLFNGITEE